MNTAVIDEIKTEKPALTRLWVALQKLSRVRDHYSRDQTVSGRVSAATAMLELADEIRDLTAQLLAETEPVPEH